MHFNTDIPAGRGRSRLIRVLVTGAAVLLAQAVVVAPRVAQAQGGATAKPVKSNVDPHLAQHPLGIPEPSAVRSNLTVNSPTKVGGQVQADNSQGCGLGANEPSVAQSKANPSWIVVAAQEYQNASGCADAHAWAFTSHDAGLHFTPVLLPGLQFPSSGDVAITFDSARQVFVESFLEFDRFNWARGRVGVEVSTDGLTWALDSTLDSNSAGVMVDKPTITVDQNQYSPHYGRIAVTWTEFGSLGENFLEAYTDNGGHTWHPATSHVNHPDNTCGNGTSPAFNASGQLMVAWYSCSGGPSTKEEPSFDGGDSFPLGRDTLISNINIASCSTFRCNSFPSLAGDPNPSDQGGDAFVVVWDEQDQGCAGSHCFSLARGKGMISVDDGNSWGGPNGLAFFHVDGADLGNKFFPSAAFAPSGRLNIGYIDSSVSANLNSPQGTSYDAWVTEASSLSSLVNNSYTTYRASSTASDPGGLGFIGDYTTISSLDNNLDTLYVYPDQRGTGNNHVSMIDLCYANCS